MTATTMTTMICKTLTYAVKTRKMKRQHRATKSARSMTRKTRTTKVHVVLVNVSSATSTTTTSAYQRRRRQHHRFVASTKCDNFWSTWSLKRGFEVLTTKARVVNVTTRLSSSRHRHVNDDNKVVVSPARRSGICKTTSISSVKNVYIYINVKFCLFSRIQ